MWHVIGIPLHSGKLHWECFDHGRWNPEEGVKVQFRFIYSTQPQRRQTLKDVEELVAANEVPWLVRGRAGWSIYAEGLKEMFPELRPLTWLKGKAVLVPEIESDEQEIFEHKRHEGVVACYVTPAALRFSFEDIYRAMWVLECDETCKQGTAFALAGVGLVTCQHVLGKKTYAFKTSNLFRKYKVEVIAESEMLNRNLQHWYNRQKHGTTKSHEITRNQLNFFVWVRVVSWFLFSSLYQSSVFRFRPSHPPR